MDWYEPTAPLKVIHTYTNRQAVEDGLKVEIGAPDAPIFVNVNVAEALGCVHSETGAVNTFALFHRLSPLLHRYLKGDFCDEGATDYPEECDPALAIYFLPNSDRKVWFSLGDGLNVYFPEDR